MIIITCEHASKPDIRLEAGTRPILIGRSVPDHSVDLDLTPDNSVSRHHARITYDNETYWIEDLGSRYGSWLNGQKIIRKMPLRSGDQIRIGMTRLEIVILAEGLVTNSVSATIPHSDLLLTEKPDMSSLDAIRRRLTAFYELGTALGTMESVQPLLQAVIKHLCSVIPDAQRGALLLQEAEGLKSKAYYPEQDLPSVSFNLANLAIKQQEAYTWRRGKKATSQLYESVVRHGTQSAMYAPLIWKDEVLGIVFVDNFNSSEAFDDDDLRLLMAMASQAAMFVKNHALQQDLRHQEVIRSNLLRQFSPQVAERLESLLRERSGLELGGERAEPVTILASDIRGFTKLSSEMEPNEVVSMLNELFGVCIPIIFSHNGTVDKYVGDAILAVFGSPEPDEEQWQNAVNAALKMQEAIQKLGQDRKKRDLPVCQVGIGIHTGAVLHGFIGSEEQMEYTIIGDAVNRASRYCDGAGADEIIISLAVYEHVADFIEVETKFIRTKHPETEPDLEAYSVISLKEQPES